MKSVYVGKFTSKSAERGFLARDRHISFTIGAFLFVIELENFTRKREPCESATKDEKSSSEDLHFWGISESRRDIVDPSVGVSRMSAPKDVIFERLFVGEIKRREREKLRDAD